MRLRSDHIAPFVFALALPMFGLVSEYGEDFLLTKLVLRKLIGAFVFLLGLWFLLWNFGHRKSRMINLATSFGLGLIYFSFFSILAMRANRPIAFDQVARFLFAFIIVILIQSMLKSRQRLADLQVEKAQLMKENYRAQIQNLNNQISPHFIFNSLNTLRSMIRSGHENAEQFVVSLSQFYGHSLRSKDEWLLPLKSELEVMKSYLFVMESRNENSLSTHIDVDENLLELKLPRLSLQLLVENCFKHNRSSKAEPMRIEVCSNIEGEIEVKNNKQPKIGDIPKSGFGLEMIRKRYDLLNIENGLRITENDAYFSVILKLIE